METNTNESVPKAIQVSSVSGEYKFGGATELKFKFNFSMPAGSQSDGSAFDLVSSLYLTCVSEKGQQATVSKCVSGRIVLPEDLKREVVDGDEVVIYTGEVNLNDLFDRVFLSDNYYVQIASRHYCSDAIKFAVV